MEKPMIYPLAKFIESSNYTKDRNSSISCIVIHITDGGDNLINSVEWLCSRESKVSAHFLIGRKGEVIQLVRIEDKAWHAGEANSYSVGIEHCARSPEEFNDLGLPITEEQYRASAELVRWLCNYLNLPIDREHIKGHCELKDKNDKPITTHLDCPNSIWDWKKYLSYIKV